MKKITQLLCVLSTMTIAIQAGAAGFALNETSSSAAGTAYAGRSSNAEDASIMASNPAGIALLDQGQFVVGMGVVVPKGEFTGSSNTSPVASTNDGFLKNAVIPFGYFATPYDDKWSFGLGIYAPFGAKTNYSDDWAGRYMANETEIKVINIQPTVAYKFSDEFSIGLGVFGSYADGTLSRYINPAIQTADVTVKGNGWAFGWSVGAIYQLQESTTFGLSYRSKVKQKLKGDATMMPGPVKEDAKLDINLPAQAGFSATHMLDDRWTLMAGATWTQWSSFDKLVIKSNQAGGAISANDSSDPNVITYVPENWKNSWALAFGGSYQYSQQLTLKAGYAHDWTPVKDEYRTARIPDSNRRWLTFGAKYVFDREWTFDAAYGYMFSSKASISERNYRSDGVLLGSLTLDGEYKNKAHVFSISITKNI